MSEYGPSEEEMQAKKKEIAAIKSPKDRIFGVEEFKKWKKFKKMAKKRRERKRQAEQAEGWEDERPNVQLIMPEYDVPLVDFKYSQPNISVDKSVRYAEHKVIGGTTVRQRLGENAPEISIEGICTEIEANRIDEIGGSETVELISNRWEGEAQVASTSTSPFDDGGARDADQEWLHTFSFELIGLTDTSSPSVSEDSGGGGGGGGPGALTQG